MSWLSKLFGFGESDTARQGAENMPARKIYSFADVETGPKLKQTIENRLAGIGTGFRPEVLSKDTAAFANQRRASLRESEIPTISTEASSRGLGRSTIPVNRIALSSQAAERDVESRLAQMEYESEKQSRAEIQNALDMYYQYTKDDIGYKNLQSEVAQADYLRKLGLTQQADQLESSAWNRITQAIGGGIYGGVTGFMTGGPLGAIAGVAGGSVGGIDSMAYTNYLSKLLGNEPSTVSKSGDIVKKNAALQYLAAKPSFSLGAFA